MASFVNAALCAIAATAFWSLLGFALARHLLPRVLAIGIAPVLGWAVHSAAALPIFTLVGFSSKAVIVVSLLCIAVSGVSLAMQKAIRDDTPAPATPAWAYGAAAILALAPAAAIFPKFAGDAVYFADPIFDHSKIAIIDAMTRQGLPPVNPVFGEFGAPGRLAYYYLWHFSAAELVLPLRVTGWEADIGLTWFTAFASLSLMMALAVWLAKDSRAAIFVVLLGAAGSLRPVLGWLSGSLDFHVPVKGSTGFSGWLFQSAWVPQHLMAASCVVAAMLLVAAYSQTTTLGILLALAVTLALTVVAGFESSTYVGGVTLAIAAVAAAPILFVSIGHGRRARFAAGLAAAAVIVAALAAPFVIDQLATVAARGDAAPIIVHPFPVLDDTVPAFVRRALDLPAYWLIELPIEFPAIYLPGAMALWLALRRATSQKTKTAITCLACLAGAGLVVAWLLSSTLGDINDLAMRAVLPTVMILIAVTAAGMMRSQRRVLIAAVALGGLLLSLPRSANLVRSDISGRPVPDAKVMAQTPELWAAVRHYAGPTDRVANNPLFLQDLTPWPANPSWALLANRSSCFAGREMALAFAPLPVARREAINKQFIRVFDGEGTADDVNEMAKKYGCDVVIVVPQDKAWNNDPFAASPEYRLAEARDGRWRIYVKAAAGPR